MNDDWLTKIAGALGVVRTPLSLGGLAVLVLCLVYNKILGLGIFPTLKDSQAAQILNSMIGYVFWLAVVAVVLGIAGYLIRPAAKE